MSEWRMPELTLSEIFKNEAGRSLPKLGQVYVVLLTDNTIKIGMTTVGVRRINYYSGISRYLISSKTSDYLAAEQLLIQEANNICGPPLSGREFFPGGRDEFDMIKSLIPIARMTHGETPQKQYLVELEKDYQEYVRLQRVKEGQ
jgi:hypothetical protein